MELSDTANKEADALIVSPDFTLADGVRDKWAECINNNREPYGFCVIQYANRWAGMMEKKIADGSQLHDIASDTSQEADTDGITGFMYGCAVSILAHAWVHGEALRRWHNRDVQIGDEGDRANESGGVLNPALLKVETT